MRLAKSKFSLQAHVILTLEKPFQCCVSLASVTYSNLKSITSLHFTGKHGTVIVLPVWICHWWGWRHACVWVYSSGTWGAFQTTFTWALRNLPRPEQPSIPYRAGEKLPGFSNLQGFFLLWIACFVIALIHYTAFCKWNFWIFSRKYQLSLKWWHMETVMKVAQRE